MLHGIECGAAIVDHPPLSVDSIRVADELAVAVLPRDNGVSPAVTGVMLARRERPPSFRHPSLTSLRVHLRR